MKKILIPICVIAVLVCFVAVFIPLSNDRTAENIAKQLESSSPADTVIIESVSKAGKLTGNGNGMQYFGAVLIKSDLTPDELSDFYSGAVVKKQTSQKIEAVEHGQMSFETVIDGDNYYIVYMFGGSSSFFANLDIRGH